MKPLVLPIKKTTKTSITSINEAICCIDISENIIYYADSSAVKCENALDLCRHLKQENSDYEYVWHNFCLHSHADINARYLVNFKLIQHIYCFKNYYNVNEHDNLMSKQNITVAFKHNGGKFRCTLDFDNNYIASFTDSMTRVLGYNPFNVSIL